MTNNDINSVDCLLRSDNNSVHFCRFSKSKGVAGHVATTGETLNIRNAYDDPRFNRYSILLEIPDH